MSRKKKALIVFLATFCGTIAIWIFAFLQVASSLTREDTKWMIVGGFFCAILIASMSIPCYYLMSFLSRQGQKARKVIDGKSFPYIANDGSYAFPKLYFTTNIGQQIFGDSPCTAFLYKDKILFRCNEDGYERNTLELLPEKILITQRHKKKKAVQEVVPVAFAMLKGRIWKTETKEYKKLFWRVDIFYQAKNGQTLLIGIEDTGNSKTGFELCERMKMLYSTNVEDIERTEMYGEHIQL